MVDPVGAAKIQGFTVDTTRIVGRNAGQLTTNAYLHTKKPPLLSPFSCQYCVHAPVNSRSEIIFRVNLPSSRCISRHSDICGEGGLETISRRACLFSPFAWSVLRPKLESSNHTYRLACLHGALQRNNIELIKTAREYQTRMRMSVPSTPCCDYDRMIDQSFGQRFGAVDRLDQASVEFS